MNRYVTPAIRAMLLVMPACLLLSCSEEPTKSSSEANIASSQDPKPAGADPAIHQNPLFPANPQVNVLPLDEPCRQGKTDVEFANAVIQSMYGRDLNAGERTKLQEPSFERSTFVDTVLKSREASNGYSRFIANLFLLSNIKVNDTLRDDQLVADTKIVSDLKKEPIELVLRNLDKPWPWFFTTRDVYCTAETAPLYGYPLVDTVGFASCTLPEDRAGFLGLASVLRAISSDFVSVNNNYKRVAFALYLAQGMKLLAATNGPKGSGPGEALPACVPITDMRRSGEGLAFGTARVPTEGSVCAGCHSVYNGPLSVAFRRFKADGSSFTFEDIEALNNQQRLGASTDLLKVLVNETASCWSFDGIAPARYYDGVPGLAELIVESKTLGRALGIQIPQLLGNREPTPNLTTSIEKAYWDGGETLEAAIKGYLLSESFQCAQ